MTTGYDPRLNPPQEFTLQHWENMTQDTSDAHQEPSIQSKLRDWQHEPLRSMSGEDWNGPQWVANFDPRQPDCQDLLFLSAKAGATDNDDLVGKTILCKYWVARLVDFRDTVSGEIRKLCRITIIGQNREHHSFASDGVADSLDMIRSVFGDGPYNPEMELTLERVKTRGGFKMFQLGVAQQKQPPKK